MYVNTNIDMCPAIVPRKLEKAAYVRAKGGTYPTKLTRTRRDGSCTMVGKEQERNPSL